MIELLKTAFQVDTQECKAAVSVREYYQKRGMLAYKKNTVTEGFY